MLSVSEKIFVKDLDWCPEHSYLGLFKIKNNKIVSVEFKLIAG